MLGKRSRRYRILLIVEMICLLLLLPGCFRQSELVRSFSNEDIVQQTVRVEEHLEFSSDRMDLVPGVYQVRVRTALETGQELYVEMRYDNSYFRALRSNGVTVLSGDDYLEFNVYVLDTVPSAYVRCNFTNVGTKELLGIEVYRTNQGDQILVFLALAAFGTLNFLLEFRRRILAGKISRKRQVVFWTLLAGVLLAYFPYLTNYFSIGADTAFHLTRIAGLTETLSKGSNLPVRIQAGWLYDHGYAVSLFEGDLFLLIPFIFSEIGFSLMASYKLFVLMILAATAVIAYQSFYTCMKEEYAALLGSMIYLLAPYHLFSVYNWGAVGEILAMAFLPLVCCGMYLLYTEDVTEDSYRNHKWYLVLGISAMIQSQMLSVEMTLSFLLLFCVIFWKKTFRRETLLQFLEAAGIVLLVNMWFWLPWIYMRNVDNYYLQSAVAGQVQENGVFLSTVLQFLPNKGGSYLSAENRGPIHVGAGVLMLLVVYVLWSVCRKKGNRLCNILVGASLLTILMSTRYLPWNAVAKLPGIGRFVSALQYPWRWLLLGQLFVALFAGFFLLQVKKCGGRLIKTAVSVSVVVVASLAVYHVNNIVFESPSSYLYTVESIGWTNVGGGEYLLEEAFLSDMHYHGPVAENGLEWSRYEKAGTDITLTLENATEETRYIEFPLLGYQGYEVESLPGEGMAMPYIAEDVGAHGDLRIAVPAGYQGDIRVSYKGIPIFHVAEIVSLVSLAAILFGYLYGRRKKVQDGDENGAN